MSILDLVKHAKPAVEPEYWFIFAARYSTAADSRTQQYDCAHAYVDGRMTADDVVKYKELWRGTNCMFDELEYRLIRLENR